MDSDGANRHARFYTPDCGTKEVVLLSGSDAHHMLRVRRLGAGDRVTLFDGAGLECKAEIRSAGRDGVEVIVLSRKETRPDAGGRVVIAFPPVKGKRSDWAIEKCSELGVAEVIPIVCARSSVRRKGREGVERWRRICVESAKQCGRIHLMTVAPFCAFSDIERRAREFDSLLLATAGPGATATREALDDLGGARSVLGVVGPEGGFSEDERTWAMDLGFRAMRMGETTLRTETAVIALSVLLRAAVGSRTGEEGVAI